MKPAAFRLSFAQQRLWFLEQLEPGSALYNLPAVLRLEGPLEVEVLERSLEELVRRHQTLRTTFHPQGGQPVQLVSPPAPLPLPRVELDGIAPELREEEARRRIHEEIERPFNLVKGPLVRALLVKVGEREHVLVMTVHHIVSDGWSNSVMVREVTALYEALSQGKPSPLGKLVLQYTDYAVWQRERLRGAVLERQLEYWRTELAGAPAALELLTDKPRPAVQTFRGAHQAVEVPETLARGLEALSQQEGVTLFMLLLAAFQVLLHRYTGQDEVCVGSPVAGRPRAELEGLIGFFVNTLVLRGRLGGNPRFRDLLKQQRETALGAYAHQEVPFEQLVGELRPVRDASRSPLFQAMLILQNTPPRASGIPGTGLKLEAVETDRQIARFELTLAFTPSEGGLSGRLQYNTDLFERSTAERMVGHLRVLLEGIVAKPDARVAELPLLTEAERRQVVREWNQTGADFPAEVSLPALIEAQVARTPGAVALAFEEERLTYAELDARANRLAHLLRAEGVGPEACVGLCLERSHELVVALLAILKSGGAYVPLDPVYPPERLRDMLQDSGARVLLTRRELASRLSTEGVRVVALEEEGERLTGLPTSPPETGLYADNAAYVLYTSGSTGRPKGVVVPHRAVSNFFSGMDARLGWPGAGEREGGVWLAVASISFDISVLELLWTLARGLKVVVQGDIGVPGWLERAMRGHGVTHLQCTPSLVRTLVQEPAAMEAMRGLRHLLVGGEALPPELARQLVAQLPSGRVLNMYGPTETTVWASTHEVREVEESIPLGGPLANVAFYVLDGQGQPVPVGVPGELYIGGEGVTRGYRHRPALTAERFVPDGFSAKAGARLYRSGDRVRWRRDGTLEFLGRVDFQVKVRGFRIELGEIEATLERHRAVRQAVVVAREEVPGEKLLVGYVVPSGEGAPDVEALRAWLRETLPEYMVPGVWMVLASPPLTPSGKVDRKALPAPERRREAGPFQAPRTAAEQALAEIWKRVLGVEGVGVGDNFFELGGDSLGGLRMVALAGQAGLTLHLRQLFQHQTLEALAAVASAMPAPTQLPASTATPERDEELPLTPWQHWYVENFDAEHDVWGLNLLWDVAEEIQPDALRIAVAALVRHHDVFRLRLHRGEGGWTQRVLASGDEVQVKVVELGALAPEARPEALRDMMRGCYFGLSSTRGPMLAFALGRMGGAVPDKLLMSIHHCAYDAYSMPLFLGELLAAYQQVVRGQPPSPPKVSASYRDFSRAMVSYGQSDAVRAARAFWLDEARLRPVEPLPVDLGGRRPTNANNRRLRYPLSPELGEAMRVYMRSHPDVQLNDLLLFGLSRAYARWSGGRALRVDVEHSGRTGLLPDVDLSRTIGPTILSYPVRFEPRADITPEAAFVEVRRTLRETLPHVLGYGFLRYGPDEVARQRLAAAGTPQVLFNNRRTSLEARGERPPGFGKVERPVIPRPNSKPNEYVYDLMVECDGAGTSLVLSFAHSTEAYREETIRALAQELFAQIAALVGGTQA